MIYSDEDLEPAKQAKIMTNDLGGRITQEKHAAVDEKQLRLTTGRGDILLAGSILFAFIFVFVFRYPLYEVLGMSFLSISPDNDSSVPTWIFAAFAWGLAEFFTRKRRMALSSMVLLLAFIGGVFAAYCKFSIWLGLNANSAIILSSCAAALAAMCHWLRFKVPITVAVGVMAIVCVVIFSFQTMGFWIMMYSMTLGSMSEHWIWSRMTSSMWIPPRYLLSGMFFVVGTTFFVVAMYWDASDRLRQTRRSDVAFWLHLFAAYFIVISLFILLESFCYSLNLSLAIAVIVLYYAVIAIVSISIERKAMMLIALCLLPDILRAMLEHYDIIGLGHVVIVFIIGSVLYMWLFFSPPCRKYLLHFYPRWVLDKLPNLR